MRSPIIHSNEQITARGRCSDLRLFIIRRDNGGFRWAALSGKTNIGTFAVYPTAAAAQDAMVERVRVFKPRASLVFA